MTMPYDEFFDIVKGAYISVYGAEKWDSLPADEKDEIILSHARSSRIEFCE